MGHFLEQRWIAEGFRTKPNPLSKDDAFSKRQQEGYILNTSIYLMVEDAETMWTVWIKYKPKSNWECMRVLELCLVLTIAHAHFYGQC